MKQDWIVSAFYFLIRISYYKVLAKNPDFTFESLSYEEPNLDFTRLQPFIEAIGNENIEVNSKIDLGSYDTVKNQDHKFSKDLIAIGKNEIKGTGAILWENDKPFTEDKSKMIPNSFAHLNLNMEPEPSSLISTTSDPLPFQTNQQETATASFPNIQPALRPVVKNHEITSTRTTTHTVHESTFLPSETAEPTTKVFEVTETVYLIHNAQETTTSFQDVSKYHAGQPIIVQQPPQDRTVPRQTHDLSNVIDPPPLHQSQEQPTHPLHPAPQESPRPLQPQPGPNPGHHPPLPVISPQVNAGLIVPQSSILQDAKKQIIPNTIDINGLPLTQAQLEVQIESTIKDKFEKILKEKLASIGISPSKSTNVNSATSISATIEITPSTTTVSEQDLRKVEPNELKDIIEAELTNGFEYINIDRLKSALSSVINIDRKMGDSASEINLATGTKTTILPQETILLHDIAEENSGKLATDADLLEEILKSFDSVNSQGLSDKDIQKIKKSRYSLERLKQLPEDVLEDLLYFYLAKDKRQYFDGILHRPFLGKIGYDITEFEEGGVQKDYDEEFNELIDSSITNPGSSSPLLNTKNNDTEDDLEEFNTLNNGEEFEHLLVNEGNNLAEIGKHTKQKEKKIVDKVKGYKKLDQNGVSFEFNRDKQKIGLSSDRVKPGFKGKYSNPEKEIFGKLSLDNSAGEETESAKEMDDIEPADWSNDNKKEAKSPAQLKGLTSNSTTSSRSSSGAQKKKNTSLDRPSVLDKIKKNPSLLFQDDTPKEFDFTKTGGGSSNNIGVYRSAILGAAIMILWSIVLV